MKSKIRWSLIYFILFIISTACATTRSDIKMQDSQNIREEETWSSHQESPEWYLRPPDSGGGYDYFVGHSVKVASEVGARDEAMVNAIKQFVRYCGVEVNIFDEYLKETTGRTSGVLAGVLSNKEQEQQIAEAYVTSIKPREWYLRRVRIYHDDTPISSGWKVSVLVKVPVEEKARVEAYAENKRKVKRKLQREKQLEEVRRIEDALKAAADYYRFARELIARRDVLSALDTLKEAQAVVDKLKTSEYFFAAKNSLHKKINKNVIDLIGIDKNRLAKGIVLKKIAGDEQVINPDLPLPTPLSVRALCYFEGDEIPLNHAPVRFVMSGKILNKTTTDKDGMAYLKVIGAYTGLRKNLKIIVGLAVKPHREVYFNLTAKAPDEAKKHPSVEVSFLYEENGRPKQMWNGMSLRSQEDFYWIYFNPDIDCYVYIYQVDSSGAVYRLFPNLEYSNRMNPVKKGNSYWIPEGNKFYLDNIVGEERIYLLASLKPATEIENLFAGLNAAHDAKNRRGISNQIKQSLSAMAQTRGAVLSDTGNLHQVKASSGEVFEVLARKLQSTATDFTHIIRFMHE